MSQIKTLIDNASVTPDANSFVKRDANGRMKSAAPVANNDVVTKGYFQSAVALDAAGIFHEGNSVNALTYGLGTNAAKWPNATISEVAETGFFNISTTESDRPPWSTPSNMPAINVKGTPDGSRALQLVSGPNNTLGFRTITNGEVEEWVQLYHSGNTNFDEFGSGVGHGATSTIAWINLPLNALQKCTGISVTGTFSLIDGASNIIRTGITQSSISFVTETRSKNMCTVRVSGNQGLKEDAPYYLQGETASSKIKVNF